MDEHIAETESQSPDERIVEFDPETESAAETVMDAIAAQTGIPTDKLESLDAVVDPEALDSLIRSIGARSDSTSAEVTLQSHGYTVTVHGYGAVELAATIEN